MNPTTNFVKLKNLLHLGLHILKIMKVPFNHLCGGIDYHLQIIVDNYISMQEGVIIVMVW